MHMTLAKLEYGVLLPSFLRLFCIVVMWVELTLCLQRCLFSNKMNKQRRLIQLCIMIKMYISVKSLPLFA